MSSQIINLKLNNWEKHNPKRDQVTYTWLKLSNDFGYDQKLYGLSASQKYVFILILCECSKQNKSEISLNLGWISRISEVPENDILELIEFIDKSGVATADYRRLPQTTADYTYKQTKKQTNKEDKQTNKEVAASLCDAEPKGSLIWEAYCQAYERRYKTKPLKNAKTFSQLKSFSKRVPQDIAPQLAEFFVGHNNYFYVKNCHPVGLMLKDAEKLHTEFQTGNKVTDLRARQVDNMQTNFDAIDNGFRIANEILEKRKAEK